MRSVLASLALAAVGAACTQQQLASPAGQLFCAFNTASGPIVAGMVTDAANPIAVLATGAAKSFVDGVCAQKGGVPVSPPTNPAAAPQVAVAVRA